MQVTEIESAGLKRQFKVVIPAAQINEEMEKELRVAGEKVRIPGFRPGYIPMKVLQQRYGKSVQSDVLKSAINRATGDVLTERKQRPVGAPQISIDDYTDGGDLTYTMTYDAFPEIGDIDYGSVALEKRVFEVGEPDIDKAARDIAARNPKTEEKAEGAKAAKGDVTVIDFKGMIDGVAFEGGTGEDFRLELGSGQFIEGFEDQLIGSKKGDDRIVNVTFPKEYPAANLAGKDATFAVKVKSILSKSDAVMDEAFAKEHGFTDLRALREMIRTQMIKEYDQAVRNQLKKQLFDSLDAQFDFPLPEGMVEMEFNTIWERLKNARAQGDESVAGKSEEALREEYQKIARRRVKLGLLLAEIGNRHKLEVTRDELGRAVMQQASQFPGQEKNVFAYYRDHPERMEELRGPILEEKAVDFILGKVKTTDKQVTLEQLYAEEAAEEGEMEAKEARPAKKAPAKKKAAGNKE